MLRYLGSWRYFLNAHGDSGFSNIFPNIVITDWLAPHGD